MIEGNGLREYTPADGKHGAMRRILIVEDDTGVTEAISGWFETEGVLVTVAHRGVEGLRHVMRTDFDAIICDMIMPQMCGDVFYLAVGRAKPHLSERFVFITGDRDRPDVAKFLWEYCGPTLAKPLSLAELTKAVESVYPVREAASACVESIAVAC